MQYLKLSTFLSLFIIVFGVSCNSLNSKYKKYIKDGEEVYPGKADSLRAYPGKNRIKLYWQISDPAIKKTKIYWRNKTDSVVVPVTSSIERKTKSVMIDSLIQGSYSFVVQNLDKAGNTSVPSRITAKAYGKTYINGLRSRVLNKAEALQNDSLHIVWGAPYSSTQLFTVAKFKSSNGNTYIDTIYANENTSSFLHFGITDKIKYRTYYKPDTTALDTFVSKQNQSGITNDHLLNTGPPITPEVSDGRFGTPKTWIVNDAGKAREVNGKPAGGFDSFRGPGHLGFDNFGNNHPMVNGKIYQTIILTPGTYIFKSFMTDEGTVLFKGQAKFYLVASKGNKLPDIQNLDTNALAYAFLKHPLTKIKFTINETSRVTFGFVATMQGGGEAFRISYVRLKKD